jgi:hypothetical protein
MMIVLPSFTKRDIIIRKLKRYLKEFGLELAFVDGSQSRKSEDHSLTKILEKP